MEDEQIDEQIEKEELNELADEIEDQPVEEPESEDTTAESVAEIMTGTKKDDWSDRPKETPIKEEPKGMKPIPYVLEEKPLKYMTNQEYKEHLLKLVKQVEE